MMLVKVNVERAVIEPLPDAEVEKQRLLDLIAPVVSVSSPEEATLATLRARDVRAHLREVERGRKSVKKPVLLLESRIDEIAEAHCKELLAEVNRVDALLKSWLLEEQKRKDELERRQQEALRFAQEERRKADEAKRLAEEKLTEEGVDLSQVEIVEQATAAAEEARAYEKQVVFAPPVPAIEKPGGLVMKQRVLKFEVTDAAALYAARPDFFDLTPKRSVIRDNICIKSQYPGLRVWEETEVNTRA